MTFIDVDNFCIFMHNSVYKPLSDSFIFESGSIIIIRKTYTEALF